MALTLNSFILVWVCVIGLCLGSFFNVVILRSLSGESIAFPPSKCPKCGNRLYFWHNIPVLSYILLKGKCFFCKGKISIQYPIVEILTMVLYAVTFLKYGLSYTTLYLMVIISGLIIMTGTDLKEKIVDCNIAISLGVVGILFNILTYKNLSAGLDSILGLVAGAILIESFARIGKFFTGKRAMGEADTYVAGALGACFGIHNLLYVLLYSFIASIIFSLPLFLYKQYKANNKLTCILIILFIVAALIYKTLWQNYITLSLLVILGLVLSVTILKNLNTEQNPLYLPFVPAFTLGCLYFIFF